jgi:hypothetical protein
MLDAVRGNRQKSSSAAFAKQSRTEQSAERKMRVPEDVFEDFKGRRKGILRALTTE